jgi:hypothetical protein
MEQLGTISLRLTYSVVPSAREGSSLAKGQPESSVETPSGTADLGDSQTARKAVIPELGIADDFARRDRK